MKTRSALRSMIQSHLDNDIVAPATVDTWINEANQWVWNLIEDALFKRVLYSFPTVVNQKQYTLAPCVNNIIRMYTGAGEIPFISERDYVRQLEDTDYDEDDSFDETSYRILPIDKAGKIYSTGTISGAVGTKLIAGTTTAWTTSDNCQMGDVLTVGTNTYNVQSVTSATALVLAQKIQTALTGSAYTLESINRKIISFLHNPSSVQTVYVLATEPCYPLLYDNDYPRIDSDFHDLIGLKGILIGHEYDEDIRNFGMVQALFLEEQERFMDAMKNRLGVSEKCNALKDSETIDANDMV